MSILDIVVADADGLLRSQGDAECERQTSDIFNKLTSGMNVRNNLNYVNRGYQFTNTMAQYTIFHSCLK